MTRIAIIGTGRTAAGLGTGWARAGHEVAFGSRNPVGRASVAEQAGSSATIGSVHDALQAAEIAVLALPYRVVEDFARTNASALLPLPVVDISNPFDNLPDNAVAGAEITARAIGPGARVIAAFKDTFARTLLDPVDPSGVARDVHFAGDDEPGKRLLGSLIEDLGFVPVDCGPLRNARILDGMVSLMIELDRRYEGDRGTGLTSWKFLN